MTRPVHVKEKEKTVAALQAERNEAFREERFEEAARLRDEIKRLEAMELGLDAPMPSGREARPKGDWKPKPLGPGGGGYDPEKKSARGRGRRGAAGR